MGVMRGWGCCGGIFYKIFFLFFIASSILEKGQFYTCPTARVFYISYSLFLIPYYLLLIYIYIYILI